MTVVSPGLQYPSSSQKYVRYDRSSQLLQDRAQGWRLVSRLKSHVRAPRPTMIAIGSGKGGVGKSMLSANLAVKIASIGYRVLLIDLDLGCANLHTNFGFPAPPKHLQILC